MDRKPTIHEGVPEQANGGKTAMAGASVDRVAGQAKAEGVPVQYTVVLSEDDFEELDAHLLMLSSIGAHGNMGGVLTAMRIAHENAHENVHGKAVREDVQ